MAKRDDAGILVAGGVFRTVAYIGLIVLILILGRAAYNFGYAVFNQQPMSPGEGQEVTVVIREGSSVYQIGRTLENKGLIEDPLVFVVQERLSNYHGQLKAGTYVLSTAYDADRIMGVLAGAEEDAMEEGS